MNDVFMVAGIQMEPILLEREWNLALCLDRIKTVAKKGVRLVVFPEATLTGYIFNSLDEAHSLFEPVPGPSTDRILDYCSKFNVYVVLGLLEEDRGKYYNTAALLGPNGLIAKYRKLHLPHMGVDRFLRHGDLPLRAYDTDLGKIGLRVCYDMNFPGHAPVLALQGAEIIILITNWPEGIESLSEHTILTRAHEHHVYCLAVNRVGEERGIKFFGRSRFSDCLGMSMAEGKPYEEDILYAEINLSLVKEKHQGKKDRRPEFCGKLRQPLEDNSRIRE